MGMAQLTASPVPAGLEYEYDAGSKRRPLTYLGRPSARSELRLRSCSFGGL